VGTCVAGTLRDPPCVLTKWIGVGIAPLQPHGVVVQLPVFAVASWVADDAPYAMVRMPGVNATSNTEDWLGFRAVFGVILVTNATSEVRKGIGAPPAGSGKENVNLPVVPSERSSNNSATFA